MEESKPRIRRSSAATRSPGSGATSQSRSSHVIDLRAAKTAGASKPALKPPTKIEKPEKPYKPGKTPARKPLAAPNQSKVPVSQPEATPNAAPLGSAPSPSTDVSLRPRRFWPAFWRFLVLLVILGALVVGGFYLYINYYQG